MRRKSHNLTIERILSEFKDRGPQTDLIAACHVYLKRLVHKTLIVIEHFTLDDLGECSVCFLVLVCTVLNF